MRRPIPSGHDHVPAPLETPSLSLREGAFPLDPAIHRCRLSPVVAQGDPVSLGQTLARCDSLSLHASVSGRVTIRNDSEIVVAAEPDKPSASAFPAVVPPAEPDDWPAFLADMGLVGMGGSMFPASIKFRAAASIHTLVVNAVECEPGVGIDEALLAHAPEPVAAGLEALAQAYAIRRTVLAVKRGSRARLPATPNGPQAERLAMPARYPAGAEKLILWKIAGRRPPTGTLPVQWGVLVTSVASLWALGRRLLEGRPSLDRPLSVIAPGVRRNFVVPVGVPVRAVLDAAGALPASPDTIVVAGGLMMGRQIALESPVLKGTLALFVLAPGQRWRRSEAPCILCGACFDACPLGLHPIGMATRIRERQPSPALEAQLDECFLCGACSAVCPADIRLVQSFREGKLWIKQRTSSNPS